MSTHKSIDKICAVIAVITLIVAVIFCNGSALGLEASARKMGYEDRIFDSSGVHTIDIVMDDWDSFIKTCENEEYSVCSVVIDGEAVKNVGIRAKGNSSLSSVSRMGSDRYSFKIEFDHYDKTKSYHGLDKLCLNNIIQDNTFMKDYLSYTLMGDFGVASPLCSFAYITVNGEDWGLYLAVEAIEESFLQRNYGSNYGELYKPDSTGFGGGRGNGMNFNMDDFMNENRDVFEGFDFNNFQNFDRQNGFGNRNDRGGMNFGFPGMVGENGEISEDFDRSQISEIFGENGGRQNFGNMGGMAGGMGSSDVKLQYIDDNFDSYPNIFNNAKTNVSDADKTRLINSLKNLSEGIDIELTVDIDAVIRYFIVHNYLVNGDSYTGSIVHNYYLYEKGGRLAMLPWDYNLAFGTFQGGNASSAVNSAIDTPVSGDMSDRPMISWIFDNEEYTELYHKLFSEFISNTDFAALIDSTAALIAEYVEKDPTKFCTYEEFEKGAAALREFCLLRAESVAGQLDGSIPSTSSGQSADSSSLINTTSLNISDMGSSGFGGFGGDRGNNRFGNLGGLGESNNDGGEQNNGVNTGETTMQPFGGNMPGNPGGELPEGFDPSAMFGGGGQGGFNGNMQGGFGGNRFGNQNNAPNNSNNSETSNENNIRPPFGNFPSNDQSNSNSTLPLLGISVGVLIIGLVV
ncbi:MAG: CotH kinase family protein, partial [Oscillospiraceae bacterium]|nr:CotH kinase family protein [Oscillospiraceae bacterium]